MEKVKSNRVIYTPSIFAKKSLFYLQETGSSITLKSNTNVRESLESFLFFIVIDGEGTLRYQGESYILKKDSCVFINCKFPHEHSSENWEIKWIHFNGLTSLDIYNKYLQRNGFNVFTTKNADSYALLLNQIYRTASSSDYLRDMELSNSISLLLTKIMEETIYEPRITRKYNIDDIRSYLDKHFNEPISLNDLSSVFFINKYYMHRAFKQKYGTTINNYIVEKRINKAKELLRYQLSSIDDISKQCGIPDSNYFSRLFKKIEGISPKDYRKMW